MIAKYKSSTSICDLSDTENFNPSEKCLKRETRQTNERFGKCRMDFWVYIQLKRFVIINWKGSQFFKFNEDNFDLIISSHFQTYIWNIMTTAGNLPNNGFYNNSSKRIELMAKPPVDLKMKLRANSIYR